MTSPYLHLPIRSHADVLADIDEARSGGRLNHNREWARAHLAHAIGLLQRAQDQLVKATERLPIGSGMDDQVSQIKDIVSDVQTKIERL